jgi:hypothetical protein
VEDTHVKKPYIAPIKKHKGGFWVSIYWMVLTKTPEIQQNFAHSIDIHSFSGYTLDTKTLRWLLLVLES